MSHPDKLRHHSPRRSLTRRARRRRRSNTLAASIASLLVVALMLRYKVGGLSTDDYKVLVTLSRFGPQSVERLCDLLTRALVVEADPWTEERLIQSLEGLRTRRVRDKTLPLVDKTAEGAWSLNRDIYW